MRHRLNDQNQKLIPLRRLAEISSYSPAYISILVQRKKLKAKKVGRNFFSTKEWFDEYLEQHAHSYKRVSSVAPKTKPKIQQTEKIIISEPLIEIDSKNENFPQIIIEEKTEDLEASMIEKPDLNIGVEPAMREEVKEPATDELKIQPERKAIRPGIFKTISVGLIMAALALFFIAGLRQQNFLQNVIYFGKAAPALSGWHSVLTQAKDLADNILPEKYLEPLNRLKGKAMELAGLNNSPDTAARPAGYWEKPRSRPMS